MTTSASLYDYAGPVPRPSPASLPFWESARDRRLVIQRSKKTGEYIFYPREVSPFGPGDELEWVEVSGRGKVFAFTVAREPTAAHLAGKTPYIIAIVELDEGPHMTANILDCDPEQVFAGMPVAAVFVDISPERTLVQFRPVEGP
jgi:uncharacterized OB-fold protein